MKQQRKTLGGRPLRDQSDVLYSLVTVRSDFSGKRLSRDMVALWASQEVMRPRATINSSPHGPRLATTGLATVTVLRPVVSSLSPETVDTVRCTAYFRCVAAS